MSIYSKENPHFFEQSLKSIFSQSITPNQFVLVKNGPLTSELEEIIETYASKFKNIFSFVSHHVNLSLGKSLDSGISICKNELIARMDSDDIATPFRCELLLKKFHSDNSLDICGGYMLEFYDDNITNTKTLRTVPISSSRIKRFARMRSPFNHSSIMFKKSSVVRCGGYGNSRRKEDFDLFSRMLNMGCNAQNIPEVLIYGRTNNKSFKRKKSFIYVTDYIKVMSRNLKFGYCNFYEFFIVVSYQLAIFILPTVFSRMFTNIFLRKRGFKL
jgi:glycosyltransferase involved in cell wall biosynthesis